MDDPNFIKKQLTYGSEDDDFVVPDHIAAVINEVNKPPDTSHLYRPPEPPAPPAVNIVDFGDENPPQTHQKFELPQQENPYLSVIQRTIDPRYSTVAPSPKIEEQRPPEPVPAPPPQLAPDTFESMFGPASPDASASDRQSRDGSLGGPAAPAVPVEPLIDLPHPQADLPLPQVEIPEHASIPAQTPKEDVFEKPKVAASKKKKNPKVAIAAVMAVMLIIVAAGGFIVLKPNTKPVVKTAAVTTQSDVNSIVAKVAKLVDLTVQEDPSQVANITDPSKLSNNQFFKNAATGDVVLVYPKNGIAVLYRPSADKVVAIGPIGSSNTQSVAGAQTSAEPTAVPTVGVAVPSPTVAATSSAATKLSTVRHTTALPTPTAVPSATPTP